MDAYARGQLRSALIDTPEKLWAYRNSAQFHALVDSLVMLLPEMIDFALKKDAEFRRKMDEMKIDLMNRPFSAILKERESDGG